MGVKTTSRAGEGGFYLPSRNIVVRQYNILKSWPYTSKFTIDHPEQIGTIFKSIGCFNKFWGALEGIRSPNPDFADSGFDDFWPNLSFSYFFFRSLSKLNQKGIRSYLSNHTYTWASRASMGKTCSFYFWNDRAITKRKNIFHIFKVVMGPKMDGTFKKCMFRT